MTLPESVQQEFEAGGATIRRLVEIVEKLDEPLPTLVDAIEGLSKDDQQIALLVAVFAIVGKRAEGVA